MVRNEIFGGFTRILLDLPPLFNLGYVNKMSEMLHTVMKGVVYSPGLQGLEIKKTRPLIHLFFLRRNKGRGAEFSMIAKVKSQHIN